MAKGKEKLIQQLLIDDFNYMFGNPGTVEEGFLDAIGGYPDFNYITCLHESVAVAMADGYARKTKKAAVVQLHSGVGLGNGIGMLYQAYRGHSPLIVFAGEAGIQYEAMEAQMSCDLVSMAKPVTKWADKVVHKDSLLRMVRRAVKIAMTPPMGPVFLSLPMDILDEENSEEVKPSIRLRTDTLADRDLLEEVADILLKGTNPHFIIGDGVYFAGAKEELEQTAKILGASVWGADTSYVNFDRSSPYYLGDLGHMFGENSREKICSADVVLIVGTYVFPEVFPSLENPFKDNAKIVHIDLNSYEIGKNYPVDFGIVAHPKPTLNCLNKILKRKISSKEKESAEKRSNLLIKNKIENNSSMEDESIISEFLKCLKSSAEKDVIIFDEGITASGYINHYFQQYNEETFFQTRGGSLGVGIPGAIGIKIASPKEEVIGFTGDGGSMYTIQALYTAFRYKVAAKFVILNNKSYKILEDNIDKYWQVEKIQKHSYPDSFNLIPQVNFTEIANSMGVKAVKVERKDEISMAIEKMLNSKEAFLIELVIE